MIYRGPFKKVLDDDGHTFVRGEKSRVCDKTYNIMNKAPYNKYFDFVEPKTPVSLEDAKPMQQCHSKNIEHEEEKDIQENNFISNDEKITTACGPSCDCHN